MKIGKYLPAGREVMVEYRTYGPHGEDLLCGHCMWDGKMLCSFAHDECGSVDDEIIDYKWDGDDCLVVWFASRWIEG